MNISRLFECISKEPDQPTLIVASTELEAQGYEVIVNGKYHGSASLIEADEIGDLNLIPLRNGVKITVQKNNESQSFRLQFLDIDAVCLTAVDSPPVIYDPKSTLGPYQSGANN